MRDDGKAGRPSSAPGQAAQGVDQGANKIAAAAAELHRQAPKVAKPQAPSGAATRRLPTMGRGR
jgi:hypothetical protein